VQKLKS